jgi:hypothetical protein
MWSKYGPTWSNNCAVLGCCTKDCVHIALDRKSWEWDRSDSCCPTLACAHGAAAGVTPMYQPPARVLSMSATCCEVETGDPCPVVPTATTLLQLFKWPIHKGTCLAISQDSLTILLLMLLICHCICPDNSTIWCSEDAPAPEVSLHLPFPPTARDSTTLVEQD